MRFSNGPVLPEITAELLGATLTTFRLVLLRRLAR